MSINDVEKKKLIIVDIRWMVRRDMPEVLRIEQASYDYPWCEEDLCCYLRQRNCIGLVTDHGDKVIGFMIYDLYKTKICIQKIAVHSSYRRAGVGTQMVESLIGKLSSHRRAHIIMNVRETNLDAQLFFQSVGFRATAVRRQFYDDSGEDAFVFEYRLIGTESQFDGAIGNQVKKA